MTNSLNKVTVDKYELSKAYADLLVRIHEVSKDYCENGFGPYALEGIWWDFNHQLETELFEKNDRESRLLLLCWYRSALYTDFWGDAENRVAVVGAELHKAGFTFCNGKIFVYNENPCVPKFAGMMYTAMAENDNIIDPATFIMEARKLSIDHYVG